MCGITGIVRGDGRPVDMDRLKEAARLIAHRGPDDEGVEIHGQAGFGHRRLSIIDLSPAGHQPMSTPDGRYTIVFNGEIYNFEELRRVYLSHIQFRSRSDTEVLLHLYAERGEHMLGLLRGMFAFAIWDAREKKLFCARDRAGKKPFFYAEGPWGIAYASEVRSLRVWDEVDASVDCDAIHQYLSFQYIPAPLSIYAGVRKLPHGSMLIWHNGRTTVRPWWRPEYRRKRQIDEATARERLRELLLEATRYRLISDVPVGAFLSGGMDSSAVVAAMARLSDRPVKTFTIDFEEEKYSEARYAKEVADAYHTDHHVEVVRYDSANIIPYLMWFYGEPYADSSAIPTWYVSRLARRHVTVVLNGDGGDESFGGYQRYLFSRFAHLANQLPHGVRREVIPNLYRKIPPSAPVLWRVHNLLRDNYTAPERTYFDRIVYFTGEAKQDIYSDGMKNETARFTSFDRMLHHFDHGQAHELTDRLLALDFDTYLPDDLLVKVDIATMANGLEARSPLLDHHLVEFAASLPADFKIRDGETKWIFKMAMENWLPPSVRLRPKMGFGVPIDMWFRGPLRDFLRDTLLSQRALARGYFRPAAVRALVEDHISGKRDVRYQLYALLALELWHQIYMDGDWRNPPPRPA
ncbi:MAG: Asparagine synthetase [glutamine-hydrolyzing] 1 [Myxococcota bacterium]|nr:Asparagine synthetase [glutamine-hydrolyzing] 1 [Myxococcota bacterium]